MLTKTGPFPVKMGGQGGHGPVHPSQGIRLFSGETQRRAIPISAQGHLTAHAHIDEIRVLEMGVRPCPAEGGDGNHDQRRIQTVQDFKRESQLLKTARRKGLDKKFGPTDQSPEAASVIFLVKVQGNASLGSIIGGPIQALFRVRVIIDKGPCSPRRVPFGRLNLDNVRPQIGQYLPAKLTAMVCQIEHAIGIQ